MAILWSFDTQAELVAPSVATAIASVIASELAALEVGDLADVTITAASTGEVLKYDTGVWVDAADATA